SARCPWRALPRSALPACRVPCDDRAVPLLIRPLRPDELHAVAALWRRSRIDAQPWLEERVPHTAEEDLAHFRDVIAARNQVWVAEVDGRAAGFLSLDGERLGHLYVDPSAQGRSVGSALLEHAASLSPGGLSLFTHRRNERARRF